MEVCGAFADCDLHAVDVDRMDVRDAAAVHRVIAEETRPALVINTAAFHNVPRCEEEPGEAFAVNATGARNVAAACRACGARLVHISTDYVFGDGASQPLTEDDRPAPLSIYGASKLAGEHLIAADWDDHVIVRSAALYGPSPCLAKDGMNFVRLMLHLAATRPEVKVVTDEVTTPTYARALARQLRVVAERGAPGMYHATCNGECSWYEFARAIFDATGVTTPLLPATAADFPSPVKRPRYSVLQNRRLQEQGLDIMPHWRDALAQYLATLQP